MTEQHSIGSPFGATSTTADVLRGIDLTGKLVVMTGGHSGIGLEATRALVDAGAHVVVPARRPDTAREALDGIPNVEVDAMDLTDLASVEAFAQRFRATGRDIHAVINKYASSRHDGPASAGRRKAILEEQRRALVERMAELRDCLELLDVKIGDYERIERTVLSA
ncbi:MAG: SDR family NAD(P)-dependent oxidoreductase [Pseudonocardiaceae bacterium]|nr:MAG: SDR family NAD(P)-dependent oxidoreductase [Pseudonocardiaceae bacterium]